MRKADVVAIKEGVKEHTSVIEKEVSEVKKDVTKGAETMANSIDNGAQI